MKRCWSRFCWMQGVHAPGSIMYSHDICEPRYGDGTWFVHDVVNAVRGGPRHRHLGVFSSVRVER